MNRLEHLLVILTEEAAEVQQAATKILRFGLHDGRCIDSIEYGDNLQHLNYEINQLMAMVIMLRNEGLELCNDDKIKRDKIDKVEKFLIYSKECGTLE